MTVNRQPWTASQTTDRRPVADLKATGGAVEGAPQLLYRVEEAAALLQLGRTTMYALIKDGTLHAVHIGRSCRISRAELERFIQRMDGDITQDDQVPTVHRTTRRRTPMNQDGLFDVQPPRGAA